MPVNYCTATSELHVASSSINKPVKQNGLSGKVGVPS